MGKPFPARAAALGCAPCPGSSAVLSSPRCCTHIPSGWLPTLPQEERLSWRCCYQPPGASPLPQTSTKMQKCNRDDHP